MLGLPLAFTAPLVLGALALLPVLYYLLRLTPPRPRQISFPPLKLILDLQPMEGRNTGANAMVAAGAALVAGGNHHSRDGRTGLESFSAG